MATAALAPPVVHLGRWAGWEPLPLTVRDARRAATAPARRPRRSRAPPARRTASRGARWRPTRLVATGRRRRPRDGGRRALGGPGPARRRGRRPHGAQRIRQVLTALGAARQRPAQRRRGHRRHGRRDPGRPRPPSRPAPGAGTSVWSPRAPPTCSTSTRCAPSASQADHESGALPAPPARTLDRLAPGIPDEHHPRDLSEGQQLALVLAIQLAASPGALLLDEPTRGLDYPAKAALAGLLRDLAASGTALAVATHDVEFAAVVADRVVVLAEGRVVADGPATDILCDSPAFAPQVAKVLAPARLLRLDQVLSAATHARAPPDGRPDGVPSRCVRAPLPRSSWSRVAGVLAFLWPLFATAGSRLGQNADAPLVFALLLPLLMAVVLFEISEGGLDVKAVAMLGVLSAVGAALRPLGAGTAGLETVFFLLVLGGRVFGPAFGFVLGLDHALRLGPDHRWRRAVAALPDARRRLGRARGRAAAAGRPPLGAPAARRLRRGRGAALRRRAQLLVLAVRERARERPVLRGRRRTVGEPAPVRRLLAGHLGLVGPRPGGDQRRPHRRDRPRRPRAPCAAPRAGPPSTPR